MTDRDEVERLREQEANVLRDLTWSRPAKDRGDLSKTGERYLDHLARRCVEAERALAEQRDAAVRAFSRNHLGTRRNRIADMIAELGDALAEAQRVEGSVRRHLRGCLGHFYDETPIDQVARDVARGFHSKVLEAQNARQQRDEAVRAKDGAYSERNKLVALLSTCFPSWLERHPEEEDWEDDWRWIVFIDLPTGQATWHIHDSELRMFDHLTRSNAHRWDGHTTEEKYDRVLRAARAQAQDGEEQSDGD